MNFHTSMQVGSLWCRPVCAWPAGQWVPCCPVPSKPACSLPKSLLSQVGRQGLTQRPRDPDPKAALPQSAERLLVFQTYSPLGTKTGRGACDLPAPKVTLEWPSKWLP